MTNAWPHRFTDQIALVTGAASGIGRVVAHGLMAEGAKLILVDRDADGLQQVAQQLAEPCATFQADVSDPTQVARVFEEGVQNPGWGLDVLVHCAGIYGIEPMLEMSPKAWDEMLNINLRGTFLMTQGAAKIMRARRRGAIVTLSSVAAIVGDRFEPAGHYASSKAAILSLTRQLAIELAPFGIRANAVCPGVIDTPMLKLFEHDPESGQQFLEDRVPLRRVGRAEEVASVVLFLVSHEASYVTGTSIVVDGGFLAT